METAKHEPLCIIQTQIYIQRLTRMYSSTLTHVLFLRWLGVERERIGIFSLTSLRNFPNSRDLITIKIQILFNYNASFFQTYVYIILAPNLCP